MIVIKIDSREEGNTYDGVSLTRREWGTLLQPVRNRIEDLEARTGHLSGRRSMVEYNHLVDVLVKVDI